LHFYRPLTSVKSVTVRVGWHQRWHQMASAVAHLAGDGRVSNASIRRRVWCVISELDEAPSCRHARRIMRAAPSGVRHNDPPKGRPRRSASQSKSAMLARSSSRGGVAVRQHVVIRREDYVAGTRERPEVGVFTQAHSTRPPVPWDQIAPGERVWMKWSGGPIVARPAEGWSWAATLGQETAMAPLAGATAGRGAATRSRSGDRGNLWRP
jgi:hypothetical protein